MSGLECTNAIDVRVATSVRSALRSLQEQPTTLQRVPGAAGHMHAARYPPRLGHPRSAHGRVRVRLHEGLVLHVHIHDVQQAFPCIDSAA